MNRIIPALVFLFTLTACGNKYKIDGSSSLSGIDGKMLYIKILEGDEWVAIDSAEVVHGLFTMCGAADSVMMTTLFLDNESVMPLILEKGNIKVSITYPQFTAKGTPFNDALYGFVEKKNDLEYQLEELERSEARRVLAGEDIDKVHIEVETESKKLVDEADSLVKKLITDNYDNVLGPSVFMMMCSSLPYPILTPQIENLLKDAPYEFKNHPLVKEFVSTAKDNIERIKEQQRLEQNASTAN